MFAGLGSLASVGAVLSILPVWLHRLQLDDREIRSLAGPRQDGTPSSRMAGLFEMAITGRGLMALAGLFVFLAAFVGASQLKPTARLPEVLAGRSALVSDYDWFAANIGPAVPMDADCRMDPRK